MQQREAPLRCPVPSRALSPPHLPPPVSPAACRPPPAALHHRPPPPCSTMRATTVAPAAPAGARTAALVARRPAALRVLVCRAAAAEAPGASADVPPLSEEVAARIAELGIDFERSGLRYLPNEARVRSGAVASCRATACWGARGPARLPTCARRPAPTNRPAPLLRPPRAPQMRAMDRKSVKFEKTKYEKCGSHMWTDVTELAQLIR